MSALGGGGGGRLSGSISFHILAPFSKLQISKSSRTSPDSGGGGRQSWFSVLCYVGNSFFFCDDVIHVPLGLALPPTVEKSIVGERQ